MKQVAVQKFAILDLGVLAMGIGAIPMTLTGAILYFIVGQLGLVISLVWPALLVLQHTISKKSDNGSWSILQRCAVAIFGERMLMFCPPSADRSPVHPESGDTAMLPTPTAHSISPVGDVESIHFVEYDMALIQDLVDRIAFELTLHVTSKVEKRFGEAEARDFVMMLLVGKRVRQEIAVNVISELFEQLNGGDRLLIVDDDHKVVYKPKSVIVGKSSSDSGPIMVAQSTD